MEGAFVVKTTNNVNVAKFATLIIGINFILGRFYEVTYLYTIGLDPRKLDLTLLDYIRTGIDLLPITFLLLFYSLFSIRPGGISKIAGEGKTIFDKLKNNFFIKKISYYWIPELFAMWVFLVYSFGIIDSVTLLIVIFSSPVLVYVVNKRKIEKIIKARISYAHSLTIKFILILTALFMIMGMIDGEADQYHGDFTTHIVSLRTPSTITSHRKKFDDTAHIFNGYTMRNFDKVTIFNVRGKNVIVNNWEILSIEK